MDEMREITKDRYRALFDAAHDLFALIHARMDDVQRDTAYQTREWSELHDLSKLAHVISGTALRYSQQAPAMYKAADEPVPFWPTPESADWAAAPLLAEGLYCDRPDTSFETGAPWRSTAEAEWDNSR